MPTCLPRVLIRSNESFQPTSENQMMKQSIAQVALVVRAYDEAIEFYVGTLGFILIEDTYLPDQDKRWVVVASRRKRIAPPTCTSGW